MLFVLALALIVVLCWWRFSHRRPTIVTSHFREDLTWLRQAKWKVVLIDHEGSDISVIKPTKIIPNLGREASSYLSYIVDNYDNLPSHIAFIHGHETAYHQKKGPLLELIENTPLKPDMYFTLNDYWLHLSNGVPPIWKSIFDKHWHIFERWGLGPKPIEPPCTDFSAQFIVSRDRIHRHPKEFYEDMYNYTMNMYDNYYIGTLFEWSWHFIFGEPWNTCFTSNVPQISSYSPVN